MVRALASEAGGLGVQISAEMGGIFKIFFCKLPINFNCEKKLYLQQEVQNNQSESGRCLRKMFSVRNTMNPPVKEEKHYGQVDSCLSVATVPRNEKHIGSMCQVFVCNSF